jgi:N-acetyl-gamma-glutamyl-phosphate reductase
MKKIAIIGASGYTGGELLRILAHHPGMTATVITSREHRGKALGEVFGYLSGYHDLVFEAPDYPSIRGRVDGAFTALPHGAAIGAVAELSGAGIPVVDLSADFRFANEAAYRETYAEHARPDLLAESAYGLVEVYRESIRKKRIVGNPGCYPTGAILGLYPLVKEGMIDVDRIIIDSKSGVSGAGRTPAVTTLYTEVAEGLRAYRVGNHRHAPEIEEKLTEAADRRVTVTFTPHLVPMSRGILTTIYAETKGRRTAGELSRVFSDYYASERFVRLLGEGVVPDTAWVRGSNLIDIGLFFSPGTRRLIVITAIDNLVKGAAGQAIQNMNLMLGLDEAAGLEAPPHFP